MRDPQAAQHVLDLLFALNRPELQDRLFGFSNVVADMMLLEAEGTIAPVPPASGAAEADAGKIDLVTISKPIWFYGLENVPGLLPPKEGRTAARRLWPAFRARTAGPRGGRAATRGRGGAPLAGYSALAL